MKPLHMGKTPSRGTRRIWAWLICNIKEKIVLAAASISFNSGIVLRHEIDSTWNEIKTHCNQYGRWSFFFHFHHLYLRASNWKIFSILENDIEVLASDFFVKITINMAKGFHPNDSHPIFANQKFFSYIDFSSSFSYSWHSVLSRIRSRRKEIKFVGSFNCRPRHYQLLRPTLPPCLRWTPATTWATSMAASPTNLIMTLPMIVMRMHLSPLQKIWKKLLPPIWDVQQKRLTYRKMLK